MSSVIPLNFVFGVSPNTLDLILLGELSFLLPLVHFLIQLQLNSYKDKLYCYCRGIVMTDPALSNHLILLRANVLYSVNYKHAKLRSCGNRDMTNPGSTICQFYQKMSFWMPEMYV